MTQVELVLVASTLGGGNDRLRNGKLRRRPSILGAIHTSELDRSEIDLSPKRECERSNANWDRSKIDLNECEHFLKANWDRS